jgi:DNA-binding transcriptional ArsR family regulator
MNCFARQAMTMYLRVLESAGIVRSLRVGRESQIELELKRLVEVQQYLNRVSQQWDEALRRLAAHVEGV